MFKDTSFGITKETNYYINQRRKQEHHRDTFTAVTLKDTRQRQVADWEHKTTLKIQKNHLQWKLDQLRKEKEDQLEQRRNLLAEKLASEDDQYKLELEQREESTEERRKKLEQRAKDLKEQRVQRDKAYSAEKQQAQFISNTDALREAKARANTLRVAHDRMRQLEEKDELKQVEREREEFFKDLWEQDRLKKEARERDEREKQFFMNEKLKETLDDQKRKLELNREEIQLLKEEEGRLMKEKWEMEEEIERRKVRDKQERLVHLRNKVEKYNEVNRQQKLQEMQKERDLDLQILNQILEQKNLEEIKQKEKRDRIKEEGKMYQKWICEMMDKETEDTRAVDDLINAENDRSWQKRMDQWEKEKKAREKLMQEVIAERTNQINSRLDEAKRNREESLRERDRIKQEIIDNQMKQQQEMQDKRRNLKENQGDILDQMRFKQHKQQEMEKQRKAEGRAQVFAEQMYQQKLQEEMDKLEREKPRAFSHLSITRRNFF